MLYIKDNNSFYPLRINEKDCQNTIDLFLFEQDRKSHYSLIKNLSLIKDLSRLVRTPITQSKNGVVYITKQELFEKHIKYCTTNETVAVKMPSRNTKLKFQNYQIKKNFHSFCSLC